MPTRSRLVARAIRKKPLHLIFLESPSGCRNLARFSSDGMRHLVTRSVATRPVWVAIVVVDPESVNFFVANFFGWVAFWETRKKPFQCFLYRRDVVPVL